MASVSPADDFALDRGISIRSVFVCGKPTIAGRIPLQLSFLSANVIDQEKASNAPRLRFHRRPLHDLRFAVRAIFSDAGHIYSAPARIGRRDLLQLGGIVAIGGIIYIYDQEIFDAFDRSRNDQLYKPFRRLGERFERLGYMGEANKYLFGTLVVGYITRIKPLVLIPAEILESFFIAGGIKNAANILVGRHRPHEGLGARSFAFNDGTSFPSGHASNIVQMANILSRRIAFKPFTVVAYSIAGTVCLERITSNAHWPSDVYFAAVNGWIISTELLKRNTNRRFKVAPTDFGGKIPGWTFSYRI
ncbi:MAG: phosphatase PAP2 family protein [FCB group bacterium]|nr:phosphatase PAP2 family protein [FCB group bacterium]